MKGLLTTIQRFSLHDGPGIRSTVFFKGCNMRCAWCHNPETFQMKPEILFYETKCVGCGACSMVCDCHKVMDGKMIFDRTQCVNCGKCADVCFSGALEFCGKEYSVEEVLQEVMQDVDYYEESKGGITLSGGEVFLQADFAAELLKASKEKGLSTAIESNVGVDFSVIEKCLPYLDLVMCDLKLFEEGAHERWTGVSNEKVKENIGKISKAGVPILLRTPVIPGVNDNEEEIAKIARFAGTLPILQAYELLNFNPLGGSKYDAIHAKNVFADTQPLPAASMERFQKVASEFVSSVKIG